MSEPAVGLVVVNYGSPALLEANLGHELTHQAGVTTVVVDNLSTPEHREQVRRLCGERGWQLVAPDTNTGFGVGVNIGFAAALQQGCEVLVALNPDACITPEVLAALAEQAVEQPLALITPRIVSSGGQVFFRGALLELDAGRLRSGVPGTASDAEVEWVTAACLVVHRQGWAACGPFDPEYFLYWEDVDLSFRARRAGLPLLVRDDLVAVHDEGGTQGDGRASRGKSDTYYRYNCRNRLLFASKWLTPGARLRWLVSTPRESGAIYLRGGRRQLLTHPRGALAALRGSVEGVGLVLVSLVRDLPARLGRSHTSGR